MVINKVSITGADDNVNQLDLQTLSKQFPFVEWAILFTLNGGKQRYPSGKWISDLQDLNLNLAAHFCGWWSKQVLEEENFELITNLHESFKRVQLNYNFVRNHNWDLNPLIEYAIAHQNREIILQFNKSNKTIIDEAYEEGLPENIHILYDSSGGRGKTIEAIDSPFFYNYTGYSGGISPENIADVISQITFRNNTIKVWIDMESGVRTDNEFDLTKVKEVLTYCENFIKL